MCLLRRQHKPIQDSQDSQDSPDLTPTITCDIDTDVSLVDMKLEQVPMEYFQGKSNIRHVRLSKNKLSSLPYELLRVTTMRSLDASDNQLTNVPLLPVWIRHLNLENNNISNMHSFQHYVYLRTLKLATCNIKEVPHDIGYLTSLETLELHENQITTIHSNIGRLTNLQRLSLHSNQLTQLPSEIGFLNRLWYLSLHYNQLTELPHSFGKLTSLMRLSLHQNQLTELPVEMSNCEQLQVVSLFKNKLTIIPESVFTGWQKCKKLALQQNCLQHLPSSITFLVSIEELWIHGNKFDHVPLSLYQLSQLQNLKTLWIDQRFIHECHKWQDVCSTRIEFV